MPPAEVPPPLTFNDLFAQLYQLGSKASMRVRSQEPRLAQEQDNPHPSGGRLTRKLTRPRPHDEPEKQNDLAGRESGGAQC
jgi:hypothetical protein